MQAVGVKLLKLMKIGIDLDEVLADTMPALAKWHNAVYETSLTKESFFSYKFWEVWGGTREEATQKMYDFRETPYFKNIKPVAGSREAIEFLKQNNDLFIVTSRQDDVIKKTKAWLARHFPGAFQDVFFANHYSQNGEQRTKKEFCDSSQIDALIDDLPEYALECLTPERIILLPDEPWNKNAKLPSGIKRVYSWREIADILKSKKI